MADNFKRSPLWGESTPYPAREVDKQTWWGDVGDNLSLVYAPLGNKINNFVFPKDDNFKITFDMINQYPASLQEDLLDADSLAEWDNTLMMYDHMSAIRKKLSVNNSITAMLMAGVLDPINLIPIPGAFGMGFVRGAKRVAPAIGGLVAGQELWRAERDPTHTPEEAAIAIAGSVFFGSLLGGGIGHLTRNMKLKRIGNDFHQASLYDEGKPHKVNTEKVKADASSGQSKKMDNAVDDIKHDRKYYDESGTPQRIINEGMADKPEQRYKDDPKLGEKDPSQMPVKTGVGYEWTLKGTVFGRLVSRFQSPKASLLAQSIASDYGFLARATKREGAVAGEGKGSVVLNQAEWRFRTVSILETMQDDWARHAGEIKEPRRVLGMPVTKWGLEVKQALNKGKSEKMTFDEFASEVTKAIAFASKRDRRGLKFGEIKHSIPEVENSAKTLSKEFEIAGKEGDDVGIFRQENGLKILMQDNFAEYRPLWFKWNTLNGIKDPSKGQLLRKNMLETRLAKLLHEMESLEYFIIKRQETKDKASAKMQEIIDDIIKKQEKAGDLYDKIMGELIAKRSKAKVKFTILKDQLQRQFDNNKRILKQLNEDYLNEGLTANQLKYRNDLIRRLAEDYVGVGRGATKKQKEYAGSLLKQINAEPTAKQNKLLQDLLVKIELPVSIKQLNLLDNLQKRIDGYNFSGKLMPTNEAHYLTRIWNEGAVRDNYDLFVNKVLIPHLLSNPRGRIRRLIQERDMAVGSDIKKLQTQLDDTVKKRAQEITNKIINETGDTNFDNINGKGIARFMMQRDLDIPNYKLLKKENGIGDFIEIDSRAITRAYFTKFGPAVEMARMFKGDRFGERAVFDALYDVAIRYEDEINLNPRKFLKRLDNQEDDYKNLIDAVLGRLGNPATNGSASNQLVRLAMIAAQLAMMGKATIASLADPAKIILSKGISQTFGRYMKTWSMDLKELNMARMAKVDLRVSGEARDVILNSARYRIMLSDGMGNYGNRKLGKWGDKVLAWAEDKSAGFYNLNLLNPWTDTWKGWVGVMAADRIIRVGPQLVKKGGVPNKWDLSILRQYGLSSDDLKQMYKNWAKANGQQSYRGKEIYYSNVQKWSDADPDLIRKYNAAIRADQINTIITPTEADKPALAFGILGRGEQKRQHNFFKIPLQFMSWSLGANNKIIMSTLQGRHKGVMSGIMAMFALGLMSDYMRNPSYWHKKDPRERVYRAVEYSGLPAYWMDVNNAIEIMSNNNFGIRPLVGHNNPFAGDLGDTLSEPFGPVGSMANDIIQALTDTSMADDRRASIIRRLIPYNNIFYLDWLFKGAQRSIVD